MEDVERRIPRVSVAIEAYQRPSSRRVRDKQVSRLVFLSMNDIQMNELSGHSCKEKGGEGGLRIPGIFTLFFFCIHSTSGTFSHSKTFFAGIGK